jgi:hypothetical protein
VKLVLQGAVLVKKGRKRGVHRKWRERRPLPGMLLHLDGSPHQWFQDQRWYDLIEVLDDASRETYLRAVSGEGIDAHDDAGAARRERGKGAVLSPHSERASHFFHTPKAGGPVSREQLTQVGQALKELGIEMIPAYSPQARGRSERRFGTWQGRLPQELRLAGIATLQHANPFLREHYIGEMNQKFSVPTAQPENAFVPVRGQDLERIFSLQHERVVAKDSTVRLGDRSWQIGRTIWRGTLAGCRVTLCEHLEGEVSIVYGPHVVGRYMAQGEPLGVAWKRSEGWQRAVPEGVRRGPRVLTPVPTSACQGASGVVSMWASPSASP